ncbi:MAG: Rrf2 family transcriptional regulator [Elusimicrobia bacterium]|nr:Rrf2 family transcriptional regulator [Elusimicrobiota bacterium]
MRISTRTRYGLRLMVEVAANSGKHSIYLKEIARNIDVSEKYLSQIIIPLKGKGLINTYGGAHSGYVLGKPSSEIKLKEIVAILEGDLNLIDCVNNSSVCSKTQSCITRDVWIKLGEKISEFLNSFTLEDLARMQKEKTEDMIMYGI